MARKSKIQKAYDEIYRRWYAEAMPKADYDELVKTAYETREDSNLPGKGGLRKIVFEAYFVDKQRMVDIVLDVCKEFNVKERDLAWIYLGHGPFDFSESDYNETELEKFYALIEKVNRGEEIRESDLPKTIYEIGFESKEKDIRTLMRLYEYNRHSHPDVANIYFKELKKIRYE